MESSKLLIQRRFMKNIRSCFYYPRTSVCLLSSPQPAVASTEAGNKVLGPTDASNVTSSLGVNRFIMPAPCPGFPYLPTQSGPT